MIFSVNVHRFHQDLVRGSYSSDATGYVSVIKIEINVETSDLNPRVMCTSKSNKKTGEPS